MPEQKFIRACSIWRALEVVGDVPTLLILESAFLGVRRFEGFLQRTSILRTLLSDRLRKLIDAGCMEKVIYCERPKRFEYRLTQKGIGLYGSALMMLRWEHKWGEGNGKIKVTLTHSECGKSFEPVPACSHCGDEYNARQVDWAEGPGMEQVPLAYRRRRRQTAAAQDRQHATTLLDTITRIIGDRWAMLVVRACFTKINTYDGILEDTAMATNILADRLKMLIDLGIIQKEIYQTRPDRYRYKLTEKGLDLYPIQLEFLKWGDAWYGSPEGPPLILTHRTCGAKLLPVISCSACGEALDPQHVTFEITEAEVGDDPRDLATAD